MGVTGKVYNFNSDGSVRAEFVIIGHGVVPLDYFAKIAGMHIAEAIDWNKSDLRGILLNAAYVNDDGQKCDKNGTPVEDEDFTLLPGNKVDEWNHQLWVNHTGTSALTDEEWGKLPDEDKVSYRRLNCMEIQPESNPILFSDDDPIYITEEAVVVLADMLAMDVMTGDRVVRRYQHECRFNEGFAQKYGYALDLALGALREVMEEEAHHREVIQRIMHCCGIDPSTPRRAMIFEPRTVNDDGEEISEPDDTAGPEEDVDTSTHD